MVDECSICLSELTSDTITTSCNHVFHEECLSSLIVKKCPLCREKLPDYVDGERFEDSSEGFIITDNIVLEVSDATRHAWFNEINEVEGGGWNEFHFEFQLNPRIRDAGYQVDFDSGMSYPLDNSRFDNIESSEEEEINPDDIPLEMQAYIDGHITDAQLEEKYGNITEDDIYASECSHDDGLYSRVIRRFV